MKPKHVSAYRLDVLESLKYCEISPGQDFHTLSRRQVDLLLAMADAQHYRKPVSANGSRARYFHDLLQRRAKSKA